MMCLEKYGVIWHMYSTVKPMLLTFAMFVPSSLSYPPFSSGIRLAVGGFSQGGALSLYLTMRKALGTFLDGSDASSVPLAASVALSSWLPVSK